MQTLAKNTKSRRHQLPNVNGPRRRLPAGRRVLGAIIALAAAPAFHVAQAGELEPRVPAWVFPLSPPAPDSAAPYDDAKALHVPHSRVSYTQAQLNDLFAAPDWHPRSHSTVPSVVARGRPPDVYACGYCHTPGGQGRPENASLAGLPASYIVQQMADLKSGARRSAWRGPYRPADRMVDVAMHVSANEVAAAADYFAAQKLRSRAIVIEGSRVPRFLVVGWVYAVDPQGGDEPLGERLLEFAPDAARHENRDDQMRYRVYVPPGSIRLGRTIASAGVGASSVACISCHGPQLRGVGPVPPLAGRSPTYILRQLLGFKTGTRTGVTGQPMLPVVATLEIDNMIDVAAYAASLSP